MYNQVTFRAPRSSHAQPATTNPVFGPAKAFFLLRGLPHSVRTFILVIAIYHRHKSKECIKNGATSIVITHLSRRFSRHGMSELL